MFVIYVFSKDTGFSVIAVWYRISQQQSKYNLWIIERGLQMSDFRWNTDIKEVISWSVKILFL